MGGFATHKNRVLQKADLIWSKIGQDEAGAERLGEEYPVVVVKNLLSLDPSGQSGFLGNAHPVSYGLWVTWVLRPCPVPRQQYCL